MTCAFRGGDQQQVQSDEQGDAGDTQLLR
jgi:serine/threonine protein kinase